jgi:hypothetical protein
MGQSELQPGLTPRGQWSPFVGNGGLIQTDDTSKEFSENGDSESIIRKSLIHHSQKKNKARSFRILASYEAEGAQGLKKPKYLTPRFSPKKINAKTFTEEEVLTRRQITKLEGRSS